MKQTNFTKRMKADLKGMKWYNFLGLTMSGIINAVGVTMLLAPLNLFDSGLSGTSMLLWQVTPEYLTLSFFLVVLNIPFYIIGLKRQGLAFTLYSVYAIAIYSAASYVIQFVLPVDVASSSPIAGSDPLLAAVFGGLVSGVGSGLTIRFGGAIDGVEVMAVTFSKHIGLTVGTFVMSYNVILYTVAAIIEGSWIVPLYSVVAYAVALKAVDFIVEGLDKAKAATIITDNYEYVAREVSENLGRGITVMNARGYYSGDEKTMLYCVVNRFQIGKLKKIVLAADPSAFVTICDVSDTFGTSVKLAKFNSPKPVEKQSEGKNNSENSEETEV